MGEVGRQVVLGACLGMIVGNTTGTTWQHSLCGMGPGCQAGHVSGSSAGVLHFFPLAHGMRNETEHTRGKVEALDSS